MFFLAEKLRGMTVGDLEGRMTAYEFNEWQAHFKMCKEDDEARERKRK